MVFPKGLLLYLMNKQLECCTQFENQIFPGDDEKQKESDNVIDKK